MSTNPRALTPSAPHTSAHALYRTSSLSCHTHVNAADQSNASRVAEHARRKLSSARIASPARVRDDPLDRTQHSTGARIARNSPSHTCAQCGNSAQTLPRAITTSQTPSASRAPTSATTRDTTRVITFLNALADTIASPGVITHRTAHDSNTSSSPLASYAASASAMAKPAPTRASSPSAPPARAAISRNADAYARPSARSRVIAREHTRVRCLSRWARARSCARRVAQSRQRPRSWRRRRKTNRLNLHSHALDRCASSIGLKIDRCVRGFDVFFVSSRAASSSRVRHSSPPRSR